MWNNADVDAGVTPVGALWRHDYWGQPMAAADSHKSWRPLATLTFRWNFQMHGLAPAGFHAANVALHALACVLVLGVARHALRDERGAVLAAALFATHPVHSEPVASIVGRADVLCGALVTPQKKKPSPSSPRRCFVFSFPKNDGATLSLSREADPEEDVEEAPLSEVFWEKERERERERESSASSEREREEAFSEGDAVFFETHPS